MCVAQQLQITAMHPSLIALQPFQALTTKVACASSEAHELPPALDAGGARLVGRPGEKTDFVKHSRAGQNETSIIEERVDKYLQYDRRVVCCY